MDQQSNKDIPHAIECVRKAKQLLLSVDWSEEAETERTPEHVIGSAQANLDFALRCLGAVPWPEEM